MVDALHRNKTKLTLDVLSGPTYATCDVVFLQEVAAAFVQRLEEHPTLSQRYHVLAPEKLDGKRDQNSVILASRARFDVSAASAGDRTQEASGSRAAGELSDEFEGWEGEITSEVSKFLGSVNKPSPVAPGDLFVVRVVGRGFDEAETCAEKGEGKRRLVLASFHGDTNGLATIPVIDAVDKWMRLMAVDDAEAAGQPASAPPPPLLVFGIDANTYAVHIEGKQQGVTEFAAHLAKLGLATCWGAPVRQLFTWPSRAFNVPKPNPASDFLEAPTSEFDATPSLVIRLELVVASDITPGIRSSTPRITRGPSCSHNLTRQCEWPSAPPRR